MIQLRQISWLLGETLPYKSYSYVFIIPHTDQLLASSAACGVTVTESLCTAASALIRPLYNIEVNQSVVAASVSLLQP